MKFGNLELRFNPYNVDCFEAENGKSESLIEKAELFDFSEDVFKGYNIGFEVGIYADGTPYVEMYNLKSYEIDKEQNYHEFNYDGIEDEELALEQFKKDYSSEMKDFETYLYQYYEPVFEELKQDSAKEIIEEEVEM